MSARSPRIDTGKYWIIPNPWDTLCFFCTLPDCNDRHPMCLINRGKAMLKNQGGNKREFVTQFRMTLQQHQQG